MSIDSQQHAPCTDAVVAAADTVRRLKFLEKLQHEINDALTALES